MCGYCANELRSAYAELRAALETAERTIKGYESATTVPIEESEDWRHVLSWDSLRMANDNLKRRIETAERERDEARREAEHLMDEIVREDLEYPLPWRGDHRKGADDGG